MQGGRKLSPWNLFVKKIYREGKSKDDSYEFKQALTDASKRKSEMKNVNASGTNNKNSRKTKKARKSRKSRKSRKMSLALA